MRKHLLVSILLVSGLMSHHALAANHPAEGYTPKDCSWFEHQGAPESYNQGDLQFVQGEELPAWSSLSDMEKYMLAGTENSAQGAISLGPWYASIYSLGAMFSEQQGAIPDQLDSESIRSLNGLRNLDDYNLNLLRNPLTGEWPRMTSSYSSPGDIYMRALTPSEMLYYANLNPQWQKQWYEGLMIDNDKLAAGHNILDCFTIESQLVSQVYYVRIYGWNGPIYTALMYTTQ